MNPYRPRYALGEVPAADSGPFFVADIYENDLGAYPNFGALASDSRMLGCIIKATQGVSYSPAWFAMNWNRVRDAAGSRYGSSWFRGCYHFGVPGVNGAVQADYLLGAVENAGGWGDDDMPPAWDLEGAAWSSAQQAVDVSSQFADRIKSQLGKTPTLYTGAQWRTLGISDRAGFDRIWSSHLNLMEPFGWPNDSYSLWQYAGDGRYYNPSTSLLGYPTSIAGWGATDMSVVMSGGTAASSLSDARAALLGRGNILVPLLVGVGLFGIGYLLYRYQRGDRLF